MDPSHGLVEPDSTDSKFGTPFLCKPVIENEQLSELMQDQDSDTYHPLGHGKGGVEREESSQEENPSGWTGRIMTQPLSTSQ